MCRGSPPDQAVYVGKSRSRAGYLVSLDFGDMEVAPRERIVAIGLVRLGVYES
jgi:hypothetical protein